MYKELGRKGSHCGGANTRRKAKVRKKNQAKCRETKDTAEV
jgi:hypothetical protein